MIAALIAIAFAAIEAEGRSRCQRAGLEAGWRRHGGRVILLGGLGLTFLLMRLVFG